MPGGPSLESIWKEYQKKGKKFSKASIYNHATNHQSPNEEIFIEKSAKIEAQNKTKFQDLQQLIMDEVARQMAEGKLKVSVRDGLTATKQKQDFDLKQQDRQDEILKMIWGYASEEQKISAVRDRRIPLNADSSESSPHNPPGEI